MTVAPDPTINGGRGSRPKLRLPEKGIVMDRLHTLGFETDAEGYVVWPVHPKGGHYNCPKLADELRDTIGSWLNAGHIGDIVFKCYGKLKKPRAPQAPKPPTLSRAVVARIHTMENTQEAHTRQLQCIMRKLEWLALRCGYPLPSATELAALIAPPVKGS